MVQWKRRKRGTPRQIGKPFPVEGESPQKKKSTLQKIYGNLSGKDRSMRTKKFVEAMKELTKPKDERLMESDVLNPEEVKFLVQRGLLAIDDDEEIKITAKGIAFLQKQRMREKPSEYTNTGEVKLEPKQDSLTKLHKQWSDEGEQ